MVTRLQKYLADAGVASRRASEEVITSGRVTVNGKVVKELGTKVDPAHDKIAVDGQPVRPKRKVYVALHKPKGFLCTKRDPEGRRTIGDLIPPEWDNLQSVGRLDNDSEGLIFLTNDGEFSLKLTHPRYGIRKKYVVSVLGRVEPSLLSRFIAGIEDAGVFVRRFTGERAADRGTQNGCAQVTPARHDYRQDGKDADRQLISLQLFAARFRQQQHDSRAGGEEDGREPQRRADAKPIR